ncbi:hypothetical protein B0J11DRAFT_147971 [Dendryphion nanum]|uniref:Uncharacterized protein n=1 Tax=Dendryphion nanum TaxID=256645 RepID=A0A9P9IY88_9PLEO|nr:hypothetical protein B0J11DRAFT_147971 [Dendryphion nanum]
MGWCMTPASRAKGETSASKRLVLFTQHTSALPLFTPSCVLFASAFAFAFPFPYPCSFMIPIKPLPPPPDPLLLPLPLPQPLLLTLTTPTFNPIPIPSPSPPSSPVSAVLRRPSWPIGGARRETTPTTDIAAAKGHPPKRQSPRNPDARSLACQPVCSRAYRMMDPSIVYATPWIVAECPLRASSQGHVMAFAPPQRASKKRAETSAGAHSFHQASGASSQLAA